jgi:hypothetical protein
MAPRSQILCDDGTQAVSTYNKTLERWENTVTLPKMAMTSWLIVIFGECQLMAWLIMRGSPVSPLIDKDFRVCHPRLARRNYAAVTLNHQK